MSCLQGQRGANGSDRAAQKGQRQELSRALCPLFSSSAPLGAASQGGAAHGSGQNTGPEDSSGPPQPPVPGPGLASRVAAALELVLCRLVPGPLYGHTRLLPVKKAFGKQMSGSDAKTGVALTPLYMLVEVSYLFPSSWRLLGEHFSPAS